MFTITNIRMSCILLLFVTMASGCLMSRRPMMPMTPIMSIGQANEKQILPPSAAAVSAEHSLVQVISVLEDHYTNAVEQYVYLDTSSFSPGESYFKLQFFGYKHPYVEKRLDQISLSESVIREEMVSAFPGLSMQISPLFVRNQYGPFGFAIGEGVGSDRCIYAWQSIESRSHGLQSVMNILSGSSSVDVRLRHCEPQASEKQLIEIMKRLRVHIMPGGFVRRAAY